MKFNTANEYTKESRTRNVKTKTKTTNREYKMKDPSLYKTTVKHRKQMFNYETD